MAALRIPWGTPMQKITDVFERLAVAVLMLMLIVTILVGTISVAWSLVGDLAAIREVLAEPKALFDVFGLFVTVLVGIELLKILRHFLAAHEVETALVVQTALIALCNKIITMNLFATSWTTLIALAALTFALAAAVYALRRSLPMLAAPAEADVAMPASAPGQPRRGTGGAIRSGRGR